MGADPISMDQVTHKQTATIVPETEERTRARNREFACLLGRACLRDSPPDNRRVRTIGGEGQWLTPGLPVGRQEITR
jgi:hypothetical protein